MSTVYCFALYSIPLATNGISRTPAQLKSGSSSHTPSQSKSGSSSCTPSQPKSGSSSRIPSQLKSCSSFRTPSQPKSGSSHTSSETRPHTRTKSVSKESTSSTPSRLTSASPVCMNLETGDSEDDRTCKTQSMIMYLSIIENCLHFTGTQSDNDVASALREVSNILGQLVKRVEGTEKEIKSIQRNLHTSTSSDSSVGRKKQSVPLVIRVSENFYSCIYLFVW